MFLKKIQVMLQNKKRSGSFSGEINWCVNLHIRRAKHIHAPQDGVKPKFFVKLQIEKEVDNTQQELLLEERKPELGEDQMTKPKYTHKTVNAEQNTSPFWDTHLEFHCFKPKALLIHIVRAGDTFNNIPGLVVAEARIELEEYRGKAFKNLWIRLENKVQCQKDDHKDPGLQLCLGMNPKHCYGMNYVMADTTTTPFPQSRSKSEPTPFFHSVNIPLNLVADNTKHEQVHTFENKDGEVSGDQNLQINPVFFNSIEPEFNLNDNTRRSTN